MLAREPESDDVAHYVLQANFDCLSPPSRYTIVEPDLMPILAVETLLRLPFSPVG
jgi:hypothetical protein